MKHSLRRIWMIALGLALSVGLLNWLGARAAHNRALPNLQGEAARAYLSEQGLATGLRNALANRPVGSVVDATFAQQDYLKASNIDSEDSFGNSLAVSGDTVVIGAVAEDSNATGINGNQGNNSAAAAGAAYVFVRSGTTWTQQAYLKASNNQAGDQFGYSVAISGDTIVVGSRDESSNATGVNGNQNDNSASAAGAAYVFVRNGTTWTQQAYLKASNTGTNDQFGSAVVLSGNTIVVGAPLEDSAAIEVNGDGDDNSAENAGAAYVFVRDGTAWTQQAYLKASNTMVDYQFGQALALSGNTIVVGSPFESSNATGINGDQNDISAFDAGAAYVFVRSGTMWTQQAYIKASNTDESDQFGKAVVLSSDTLVIGAPGEDSNATGVNGDQSDNSISAAGAAYVFVRSGAVWSQQAYLKASNTGAGDAFGIALALSGDVVVVGANLEDCNATGVNGVQSNNSARDAGSAYAFERSSDTWAQQAYLKASNTGFNDQFGSALAFSGNTLIVGANLEDSSGDQTNNLATDSGAAYVFTVTNTTETTISKAFNPASISVGGNSTVTLILANPQTTAMTNASFTDMLTGLSAVGGAVGGTCMGTTPGTLSAGETSLSFSGITIPASGNCTVTFAVTSDTPGTKTNQTSGVTTTQTPTAGPASNTATLTVTPATSPPVVTITDPVGCTGSGDALTVSVVASNPTAQPQTINLTATLPANLIGLAGTGTTTAGTAPVVTATGATFSVSLAANQTATATYRVQIGEAPSGASLCITTTSTFGGTPNPPVETCVTLNCPTVEAGLPLPAASEASDQKVGSVLVYNLYSSSATSSNSQNTRISLTNTNSSSPAAVQLFFVDGSTNSVTSATICLKQNQTASFLAADVDPGMTGYLVAVAVDASTGCPVNFNFLVGSAFVKLSSGHQAKLNAEGFAALSGGLPACNPTSMTAQLNFDGISYNRAPRMLALDTIAARAEGNDVLLILNRFGGNLATGAAALGNVFGVFYDDGDGSLGFSFSSGACQFRSSLSNNFPRTMPRFEDFIPAGRTGWAKFYAQNDQGMLGAAISFNQNTGASGAAFSGGGSLHRLSLTVTASLTIPIFLPNCQM
ncbi:MAG: hypothetical protein ABI977_14830 [Acidobacteriota bacterium]